MYTKKSNDRLHVLKNIRDKVSTWTKEEMTTSIKRSDSAQDRIFKVAKNSHDKTLAKAKVKYDSATLHMNKRVAQMENLKSKLVKLESESQEWVSVIGDMEDAIAKLKDTFYNNWKDYLDSAIPSSTKSDSKVGIHDVKPFVIPDGINNKLRDRLQKIMDNEQTVEDAIQIIQWWEHFPDSQPIYNQLLTKYYDISIPERRLSIEESEHFTKALSTAFGD